MISEGSCSTEEWSNGFENSAFWRRNTFLFNYLKNNIFYYDNSQYYCISDQINAVFFQKHQQ